MAETPEHGSMGNPVKEFEKLKPAEKILVVGGIAVAAYFLVKHTGGSSDSDADSNTSGQASDGTDGEYDDESSGIADPYDVGADDGGYYGGGGGGGGDFGAGAGDLTAGTTTSGTIDPNALGTAIGAAIGASLPTDPSTDPTQDPDDGGDQQTAQTVTGGGAPKTSAGKHTAAATPKRGKTGTKSPTTAPVKKIQPQAAKKVTTKAADIGGNIGRAAAPTKNSPKRTTGKKVTAKKTTKKKR